MSTADWVVVCAVFGVLAACLIVDMWVRNHEDELDRAARRRVVRELARRQKEIDDG